MRQQHFDSAQRQHDTTFHLAPMVSQVYLVEAEEVGLHSRSVFAQQLSETNYSPTEPSPMVLA